MMMGVMVFSGGCRIVERSRRDHAIEQPEALLGCKMRGRRSDRVRVPFHNSNVKDGMEEKRAALAARKTGHTLSRLDQHTRLVEEMGEEQKVAGRSQNSRNPELRASQTLLLSPLSPAPWCNTDFLCVAIQTRPSSLHPMTAPMLGLSPVKRKTHEMDTHPCSIPLTRLCSGRSLL
jgi:hypothetical protein